MQVNAGVTQTNKQGRQQGRHGAKTEREPQVLTMMGSHCEREVYTAIGRPMAAPWFFIAWKKSAFAPWLLDQYWYRASFNQHNEARTTCE